MNRALAEPAEGGGVAGWLGTFTDVDEAKRLLDEQTRLQREAQQAVSVRDEFLSIASHELRTPLMPLSLAIHSLVRSPGGDIPERVLARLKIAARQVDRLGRLLDELLDVTRITTGRLRLELERVDLAAVVRDVIARFDEQLTRSGSRVETHADAAVVGRWDRLRVEQIVTNLLSNAIKYGAGKPIEVNVAAEGGEARLLVRDQGLGIAADDVERIFERFERAGTGYHDGLGLGLYIVRQIVELHGGSIRVASLPGRGAAFTVALPAETAALYGTAVSDL